MDYRSLKNLDPNNTFFTSDTHFGHKNIINLCHRPFDSVEEMNEAMVTNWNNTVNDDSIIFHLGDIVFGGTGVWENTVAKLKGHIILILGNHECKNMKEKHKTYFDFITPQVEISIEGREIILNHYPFLTYGGVWRSSENAVWQLHGHCHTGPNSNGADDGRCALRFPTQLEVGVDAFNFTPVSWKTVKDIIENQVINYYKELPFEV